MGAISATYASPGLRHGLLLEDHPEADVEFTCEKGTAVGIPPQMGGNEDYCVARITFPAASKKPVAVGYKAIKSGEKRRGDHDSDVWLVLCTKALGRALKRAGYPSDTMDLKALVHWRQREAEITSITAGTSMVAIGPADLDKALTAAARASDDEADLDDGDAPVKSDAIEDAVIVDADDQGDGNDGVRDDMIPPDPGTMQDLRSALGALGPRQKEVTEWCRENGMKVTKPQSQAEALSILEHARNLASETIVGVPADDPASAASPEPPPGVDGDTGEVAAAAAPSESVADLEELIGSLAPEEDEVWSQFLATLDLKPGFDVASLDQSRMDDILHWFTATSE